MAFSNGSPPWHLSHRFSVENKEHKRTYTKPEQRSFEERRGEWEGTNKGKKLQGNSKQATRAKLRGNGLNAHSKCDHLLTKGNLPVKYDY